MKHQVLITAHSFGEESEEAFKILKDAGIEPIIKKKHTFWSEDELIKIIGCADGIIVGSDKITKKFIDSAPRLKIIAKHGVGVDNIDIDAATKKGIVVTAAIGSNTISVAELTLTLMLNLARNIQECNYETKLGKWNRIIGVELKGKTVGIIGTGRIGKEVAKRSYCFGMNILAFDTLKDQKIASEYNIKYVNMETLLKNSDFITLHVPLTEKTKNMINGANINLLKPSAYIINTARGGLINEKALYDALKDRKIAGAAIDTFELEPPVNNPLLLLKNLIATPHIGAYTHDAINKMSTMAAKAVADFFNGNEPYYIVNKRI